MPVTSAAVIAGGSAIGSTISGLFKNRKAKKLRNKAQQFYKDNPFEIPESEKGALNVAERNASSTMLPAEDLRQEQLGAITSQGLGAAQGAATSSSDVLNSLTSLFQQQTSAEQNLAIAGANRYDSNQQVLQQELGRMASWENERWNYNVLAPYKQMMGQAEAYNTQGNQLISQGINTAVSGASLLASGGTSSAGAAGVPASGATTQGLMGL